MYQSIYYNRKSGVVHLWDDEKGHLQFQYKPYAYKVDSSGEFTTIDGKRVRRVGKWSKEDVEAGLIYESDVPVDTRILIDHYTDSDNISTNHRILNIDIEVDSTKNYPDLDNPVNAITAISLEFKPSRKEICFILDPESKIQSYEGNGVMIRSCKDEQDLLLSFLAVYSKYKPTVITGWNIDFFDIPYLCGRLQYLLGEDAMKTLSPIGIVERKYESSIYEIAGVNCLDYLALYKKFTPNEEPSYTLDAIAKKIIGKGKTEYTGTLDDLYRNDIEKFIEYNLNDVRLVSGIDDKLDYIDITMKLCHKGHVPYSAIWHSSRYLDGALLTYMKRIGIVGPNGPARVERRDDEEQETAEGAYVKPPIPGRYKWMTALDATSLYPSVIMTCNISGETLIGKLEEWVNVSMMAKHKGIETNPSKLTFKYRNGKLQLFTLDEFKKWLHTNQYCVAGNGAVYITKNKGFIPAILEKWFEERVEYKRLMVKYAKEGNASMEYYYDSLQYVTKILLNSMYGVLGLSSFRFYNIDNVEAVTITGQDALRFADIMGNYYIKNTYKVDSNEDYCKYSDTDSCYFQLDKIIKHNGDEVSQIRDMSAKLAEFINSNLELFATNHLFTNNNRLVFKEESIISSGFWIAKKRYAYHKIFDLEKGIPADKVVVKGLDVVRSNFPKMFRNYMNSMLSDILKFVDKDTIDRKLLDFKRSIPEQDVLDIAKPTSAKNLDSFKCNGLQFKKGTPAHIKAALAYNHMLKLHNLDSIYPPIKSGGKIKWIHLIPNQYGLEVIAFTGNSDPPSIMDFIRKNIDYTETFRSNLENKLQSFYDALNFGKLPDESQKIVSSFFDF